MSFQELLDAGLKGVLDAPNFLRRKADELGTSIYGVLDRETARLEDIARPRAEEFFGARAGSQAGAFAVKNRNVLIGVGLLFVGLIAGLIFTRG